MKHLLAALLLVASVPAALAQYPKTITLAVTKITRAEKATPTCGNCAAITTVEAHTATANFVLVCESNLYPEHAENDTVCAQFETGTYEARMLSPELVTFWLKDIVDTPGAHHLVYSVRVEESRGKN